MCVIVKRDVSLNGFYVCFNTVGIVKEKKNPNLGKTIDPRVMDKLLAAKSKLSKYNR